MRVDARGKSFAYRICAPVHTANSLGVGAVEGRGVSVAPGRKRSIVDVTIGVTLP